MASSRSPSARAASNCDAAFAADEEGDASLVADAVTWASTNGMVVGLSGVPGAPESSLIHAPLSARPAPLPRKAFEDAAGAATHFNDLAARASLDEAWLEDTLSSAARADEFTARLLKVLGDTREYRRDGREVVLLLSRSDYLLDAPSSTLLQVELNTIASSFGCLGDAASRMHAALANKRRWGIDVEGDDEKSSRFSLPANGAAAALAGGLAAAFFEVVGRGDGADSESICLFVVQPGEKNAYDQALLAENLWNDHGVRSVRATLRDVAERGELRASGDENDDQKRRRRPLYLDGRRVAVAYLRSGYAPTDYPTEVEWSARETLEKSDAALCPSVALQLAGAKKVQQALAAPGATERFLGDESSRKVRAHYAGLWGLDGSTSTPGEEEQTRAANEALREAVADPGRFVLKPQREGGGNNLYGEKLRSKVLECGSAAGDSLAGFILMQRIQPSTHEALLVRAGSSKKVDAVSELGIFGVHLRRGSETLLNTRAGHLLRTKPSDADEGGVASGFAVLDSPMLVDDE